jgi:hypothetical protein
MVKSYFFDLVYEPKAQDFVEKTFPDAKIEDASTLLREGRFQVTLPENQRDAFYVAMINEGWVRACLGFELMMQIPESHDEVRRLIKLAEGVEDEE